jgi:hypothetical protein
MTSKRKRASKPNCLRREPDDDVKRKLRQDVGYVCPVPSCQSPYLEWHHFDPAWSELKHHNPDGMIALCRNHHPEADGGAFTVEQLHDWKRAAGESFERTGFASVGGAFNWMRRKVVVRFGCQRRSESEPLSRPD